MVGTFIIAAVTIYIIRFFVALNRDNEDLRGQSVDQKFGVIVNLINIVAYHGHGQIIPLDRRSFNLYEDGENQIINFHYSTGHLAITWKYKYFQKAVSHSKQFGNVRNISIFEQGRIVEQMIEEMEIVVSQHKINVLGGK